MFHSGLAFCVRGLFSFLLTATLFLALFAGLMGAIILILAGCLQTELTDSRNIYLGLVCGLIAWLFLAVFLLRRETMQVPFKNRKVFLQRIKTVLGEMGYEAIFETEDHVRFHPSFSALVMGGGVVVRANGEAGTITGPRLSLERMRRRLRLFQHLAHAQEAVQEVRRRPADLVHRRVQVSLRLPPAQWADVLDHLIDVLGKEEILVCDVHLLAQSAGGIRETVIDDQVRDWLQARGIHAEIRKEHVQIADSVAALSAHSA
jgi:hypothetical protein